MSAQVYIGILACSVTLAQSCDVESKTDPKPLRDLTGAYADAVLINKRNSGTIRFAGALPDGIALGVGTSPITEFTGGRAIISRLKITDKKEDYIGGEIEVKHYPYHL